jgi:hypothetical protein
MPGTDFDLADWAGLPPLDDADLPAEPPPEREYTGGITIGSGLADTAFTSDTLTDLGHAIHADLFAIQPGLGEIARLGLIDFTTLDAVQRIDALLAFERQHAWAEARRQELLALISIRDRTAEHWCVEEVGAALRLSGPVARTTLADAEQLATRLPATLTALSDGQVTVAQAKAVTKASYQLPDDLLPAFETRVLRNAEHQSLTNLTRTAHRAVLALDPATSEQKHQQAVEDRQLRITPAEHGMAWLIALLPADQAQAIYTRLDGAARLTPSDDDRSMDQLRADALINGVLNGIEHGLPTEQGHRPSVNVIISLSTLTGQDNEPGWLNNYGPITAGHARRIAHDPTGTWRRLITDPVTGQLLDYGTTRYKPPQHLIDHVTARDGQCTFPYCSHTARRSDLDHVKPYPHGPTAAANLQPLHRRHHNAKTHAGWQPQRNPTTGHTTWTSPQKRTYQTQPPERWTTPEPPPF